MTYLTHDMLARNTHNHAIYKQLEFRHDPQLGLRRQVRARMHPEVCEKWGFLSEHDLGDVKPPDHVQSAFEELIGKEPEFMVRLHPLWKRWCCFQRYQFKDPKTGEAQGRFYKPFFMAEQDVQEGRLPSDYEDKPWLWHLRGLMGEFRELTRADFELCLETTDTQRYTTDEINEKLDAKDEAEERDRACKREAWKHDFLGYYFNHISDMANRDAGSGWHMRSTDQTIGYKENPERYYIEQKNGFRVRAKQGSRYAEARKAELDNARVLKKIEAEEQERKQDAEARRRLLVMRARQSVRHNPEKTKKTL